MNNHNLKVVIIVISVLLLTVLYSVLNCEFLKKRNTHRRDVDVRRCKAR